MRALLVMSCVLAACDAGEKPAPPTPAKPGPTLVSTRDGVADSLMYLPADSELVIKVDVAALRKAKLWTTYKGLIAKGLTPAFAGCDYDPLSEVSLVTIGLPAKSELGVFVVRGIDREQTLRCLRASQPDTTVTFEGEFFTVTPKSGAAHVLTFVDGKTMVMQTSPAATKQSLTQVLQSRAPLAQDKAFATTFRTATQRLQPAPVFVVSRPGSTELGTKFSSMGLELDHLSGTLNLSDRLDLRFQLEVKSPEQATQFAQQMQTQLTSIKQMLDRGTATAQGTTITLDIGMAEAQLKSMAGMLGGMGS